MLLERFRNPLEHMYKLTCLLFVWAVACLARPGGSLIAIQRPSLCPAALLCLRGQNEKNVRRLRNLRYTLLLL